MNSDRSTEKPNRIPQIYGYTVCLIAVVAFLISINGIVDASFTLANPMHGPYGLTMLIAIGLFAWHWGWLRARAAEERATSGRGA
jgi:hypothetical protein